MKSGMAFDIRLADAGLLASVGLVWAALFVMGRLDGTWLLTGFLAAGLGVPFVGLIERVSRRMFTTTAPDAAKARDTRSHESTDKPEPRLRVLITSALMQAVSLGFIGAYFSGSPAVGVFIGLLVGTLSLAVATLLARRLSPA